MMLVDVSSQSDPLRHHPHTHQPAMKSRNSQTQSGLARTLAANQ